MLFLDQNFNEKLGEKATNKDSEWRKLKKVAHQSFAEKLGVRH